MAQKSSPPPAVTTVDIHSWSPSTWTVIPGHLRVTIAGKHHDIPITASRALQGAEDLVAEARRQMK